MDRIDPCHEAILGLRQLMVANHESNERHFAEIKGMLLAIIEHHNVPYKPDMGFHKDRPNGQGCFAATSAGLPARSMGS